MQVLPQDNCDYVIDSCLRICQFFKLLHWWLLRNCLTKLMLGLKLLYHTDHLILIFVPAHLFFLFLFKCILNSSRRYRTSLNMSSESVNVFRNVWAGTISEIFFGKEWKNKYKLSSYWYDVKDSYFAQSSDLTLNMIIASKSGMHDTKPKKKKSNASFCFSVSFFLNPLLNTDVYVS